MVQLFHRNTPRINYRIRFRRKECVLCHTTLACNRRVWTTSLIFIHDSQASEYKALKTSLSKWGQLIVCLAVVNFVTRVLFYLPSLVPIGMGRREPLRTRLSWGLGECNVILWEIELQRALFVGALLVLILFLRLEYSNNLLSGKVSQRYTYKK